MIDKKKFKKVKCAYCLTTENLTIDHKHPKLLGGTDDKKNLQCLCKHCNEMKSGIPHKTLIRLWKWMREIESKRLKLGYKLKKYDR